MLWDLGCTTVIFFIKAHNSRLFYTAKSYIPDKTSPSPVVAFFCWAKSSRKTAFVSWHFANWMLIPFALWCIYLHVICSKTLLWRQQKEPRILNISELVLINSYEMHQVAISSRKYLWENKCKKILQEVLTCLQTASARVCICLT